MCEPPDKSTLGERGRRVETQEASGVRVGIGLSGTGVSWTVTARAQNVAGGIVAGTLRFLILRSLPLRLTSLTSVL